MKFSVMSRNAKPTAKAATPASPRNESTASVSPSTPRAPRMPPMMITVAITDPRTDRNSTLPLSGQSSVSLNRLNSLASIVATITNASASSATAHFFEITPQYSCSFLSGKLPAP